MISRKKIAALSLLLISHIFAAKSVASVESKLRSLTRNQLVACEENLSLCGANDIYEVDSELRRRLPSVPVDTLVRCFADWHICGVAETIGSGWAVSDELTRRHLLTSVLTKYGHSADPAIQDGLEHLAYRFHNAQAKEFLTRVFTERRDDGENLYWPAKYLAKQCETSALRFIADKAGNTFAISSYELSTSTIYFGNCHYRPAIPFLVGYALDAASLNLVDAADTSLRKLYPKAPNFSSLDDEKHWFCRRAHRDGYKIDCEEASESLKPPPADQKQQRP